MSTGRVEVTVNCERCQGRVVAQAAWRSLLGVLRVVILCSACGSFVRLAEQPELPHWLELAGSRPAGATPGEQRELFTRGGAS